MSGNNRFDNIRLRGTVIPTTPTLTASTSPATSPTALSNVNGTVGAANNPAQSYTLAGSNLGTTAITIAAPANFEISTTSATAGFTASGGSLSVTPGSGSVNQTVYVRLSGSATAGAKSGTITNTNGTQSADVSVSGTATAPDTTPPVFAGGSPAVSAFTTSGFTLSSTLDEAGTTYYVVVADGAPAPTVAQVLAGRNAAGAAALASGNFANPTANTAATAVISTLSASTNYDVYVVAQDAVATPNVQAAVTGPLDVTTASPALAAPTVSTTTPATGVTATGATIAGNITSLGTPTASTAYGFVYSTSASTATALVLSGTGVNDVQVGTNGATIGSYNTTLGSLTASTLYYYRAYASNSTGTGYGNVGSFTTLTPPAATFAANPSSLAFSATVSTTATASSYSLTGTNLPAGATVDIASANAAFEVSITSATSGFAATQQATVPSNGTLNQTVYVRFMAPAAPGGTSSIITNTVDALTATVSVEGTATAVPMASAPGELLLEDNFNYPVNTPLTSRNWTAYSSSSTSPIITQAGNLTHAQYPRGFEMDESDSFTGSTTARLLSGGQDVSKGFTLGGATTIYVAAVVTIVSATTDGDYFMLLRDVNNTSAAGDIRGRIFAKRIGSTSTFQFGVGVTSSTGTYATGTYTYNTPYLIVLKYNTAVGPNTASLFIYPVQTQAANAVEPSAADVTVTGIIPASSTGSLNALALRQEGNSVRVDGVRVATGWGSVIGQPYFQNGAATVKAGNYYNLTVDNASSLTTAGAVIVENNLNLITGNVNTTATDLLTVYRAATISGGGTSSYVNGPLARGTGTTAAAVTFPIGKGTTYRPLTLNIATQSSARTYSAEQFNTTARTTGLKGPSSGASSALDPLTRVSNIRYFNLTPIEATGTFSGSVTLSFGADDYVNSPGDNSFVIAKRSTSADEWGNIGRTSSSVVPNSGLLASGTLTSGVFTTFSDFTLASTAPFGSNSLNTINPLPVELSHLTAQRQPDNTVAVKWTTASEKNSAHFEVQRSLDGREFATVATVVAQGNSTQPTAYSALDKTASNVTLYYRLRQVDRDGTMAHSPVVTVAGDGTTAKILLYPNPAHSSISFVAEAATPYRVLNQLGQSLLSGTTEAGTAKVGIEQLPAGLYFLELQTTTGRSVQKFEKE